MTVATGHSEDLDSADAIAEALDACSMTLGGRAPQAGLLFAGVDHDHRALLDGIEARHPGIQLVGCTTHGELSSAGFAEDSVVVMLFHSDRVSFAAGVGEGAREDPDGAARQATTTALDGLGGPPRLCLLLPEGISTDTTAILGAVGEALGGDVPVCGGTAGDQHRLERTYQFCNGVVYSDAVPVLLLGGPLRVATGVASGWEPLGEMHEVTDADGLAVSTIGGRPVLALWRRYFGSSDLNGTHALAVYPDGGLDDAPEATDGFYLTSPGHFEDDGRLIMNFPVPVGARVRFANATRDQILDGTRASADAAAEAYGADVPEAALVFSCSGRHNLLGTRVASETGVLRDRVGDGVPVIGFYAYGEFCSLPDAPTPRAHNCTFVTVLIGEDRQVHL